MPIVIPDAPRLPVYPNPSDVRPGVAYGPTGTEYVGGSTVVGLAADAGGRLIVSDGGRTGVATEPSRIALPGQR